MAPPCDAELAAFEAEVHGPILVPLCSGCHNPTGEAADTRLRIAAEGPSAMQDNWQSAGAMAALELDGASILLLRPSGRHPDGHSGGALVRPDTPAYAALARFVQEVVDPTCNQRPPEPAACDAPAYGPRLLRRLTRAEYDATLEDLFGRTSTRAGSLAVDPTLGGFDNHARALVVGALLADQLRLNAEEIAAEAVMDLDRLLPCTPTPDNEAACRDLFIRRFATRAFRRAPAPHEETRYVDLFEATARGDFTRGVKWVVTAVLQSPHFLYRSELGKTEEGGTYRLTGDEIASQLSFFLTGGPPDDELRVAAGQDILQSPVERERQARRLLSTPAGQRHTARFFEAWLGLERLQTVAKDAATYPEFTPEIRAAMAEETRRFITWTLLRGTGRLPDLFTASHSFIDPQLEAFYGETATGEPDADGFRRVEAPGRRFGLLTQGSLLTAHAKANEGSPIHRGKLVRERLLCQPLQLPPPGLVVEPPQVDPNLTTRERYAAHAEVEPCRSCHRLIDPIGFGFGVFDGVGRYRPEEAGRAVETHGEIVETAHTNGAFDDLEGLARLLADSEDVRACFSTKTLRWAYGLEPSAGLACALEEAHAQFEASDWRVDALLIGLARSEHLIRRAP